MVGRLASSTNHAAIRVRFEQDVTLTISGRLDIKYGRRLPTSTLTCSSATWTGTDLRIVTIRFSAAVGTSSMHTTGNRLIIAWLSSEFFII